MCRIGCALLFAIFLLTHAASAAETRFRYDRSGNIVEIAPTSGAEPSVDGLDPAYGAVGTSITVHGRNFSTSPSGNNVDFGGVPASVQTATDARIAAVVPDGARSGPVGVSTASGFAQSLYDFVVLPSDMPAEQVGGHSAVAETETDNTIGLLGGRWGLLRLQTDADRPLSFNLLSIEQPVAESVSYRVISSRGTQLLTGSISAASPTFHLPVLPTGEGVTVALRSTRWARVHYRVDRAVPLPVDGDAALLATTINDQSIRAAFAAEAGQSFGIGFTNVAMVPAGHYVNFDLYLPNGAHWKRATCGSSWVQDQCAIVARDVPLSGTYTLVARQASTSDTQLLTSRVWLTREVNITLEAGSVTPLQLPRYGSIARLHFQGVPGERLQLVMHGVVNTPNRATEFVVHSPAGECIVQLDCRPFASNGRVLVDLPQLTEAGEYQILLRTQNDGRSSTAGSAQFTLTRDIEGAIAIDNDPVYVQAPLYGQRHRITFEASAGDFLGLGFDGVATTPTNSQVRIDVYRPDGTYWTNARCGSSWEHDHCGLELKNLPQSGTYTLVTRPGSDGVQAYNVRLWLSRRVEQALGINAPLQLDLTRPGQYALLTFGGTAGQELQFGVNNLTNVPGGATELAIRSPDGICLLDPECDLVAVSGAYLKSLSPLAQTGTYSVEVGFWNAGKQTTRGSGTYSLTADVDGGELNMDGDPSWASTQLYGQRHRFTFEGVAGAHVGIGFNGVATTPTNRQVRIDIYRPDGTYWSNARCGSSYEHNQCDLYLKGLPQTGTYTVIARPVNDGVSAYSVRVWLSSRVERMLDIGTPLHLELARPGQFALLSFTGAAGQELQFGVSGIVGVPGNSTELVVRSPGGTCLLDSTCKVVNATGSLLRSLPVLTESGTYNVEVGFWNGGKQTTYGSATYTLTSDEERGELNFDGESSSVTSVLFGQRHRFTFDGLAGEHVGIGFNGVSTSPAGGQVRIEVYRPDGSYWTQARCGSSYEHNNCDLYLKSLTQSGTYIVLVRPHTESIQSYNVRIWLSRRIELPLELGVPLQVDMARPGQYGLLTFHATAGQQLDLQVTNIVNVGGSAELQVRSPSGACLLDATCKGIVASGSLQRALSATTESGAHQVEIGFWNNGKQTPYGSGLYQVVESAPPTAKSSVAGTSGMSTGLGDVRPSPSNRAAGGN